MSTHTPGPWILEQGVSSNVVLIDSKITNGAVGEIVDCRNSADARLIAAAPDLLEFAKEWLERQGTDENYMVMRARAAIAKAGGAV
jgi:hypothetical protein